MAILGCLRCGCEPCVCFDDSVKTCTKCGYPSPESPICAVPQDERRRCHCVQQETTSWAQKYTARDSIAIEGPKRRKEDKSKDDPES